MTRFNRRYYQSLAYAKHSPANSYIVCLLRYAFNRIFLRHKTAFAVAGLISFLCGVMYLVLYTTRTIEARIQDKYSGRLAKLRLENDVLKSQIEVMQALRVDFIREVKVAAGAAANASSGQQQHWNPLENPHVAVSGTYFDYYSLSTKLASGLEDAWTFAADHLPMKSFAGQRYYIYEWYRVMVAFAQQMGARDLIWRQEMQLQLGNTIHTKLVALQEPGPNTCPTKYIQCPVKPACRTLSCLLHHYTYCLSAGLALNRSVLFDLSMVSPLTTVIQKFQGPTVKSCFESIKNLRTVSWNNLRPGRASSATLVILPLLEHLSNRTTWAPPAVPTALADRLHHLTQSPFSLFAGHILDYILRPSARMLAKIDRYWTKLGLAKSDPFVGIHIHRRSEKGLASTSQFELKDYMVKVQEFYERRETALILGGLTNANLTQVNRNIYLATDDPDVWITEVPKFRAEGYKFFGSINHSRTAFDARNRFKQDAIEQLYLDLWMLSSADYLVCTMASAIGRVAYELMQVRAAKGHDMSTKMTSLEGLYYFEGQTKHIKTALVPHSPFPDPSFLPQLAFNRGDHLSVTNHTYSGHFTGEVLNGKGHSEMKYYPKFKVEESLIAVPFEAFN